MVELVPVDVGRRASDVVPLYDQPIAIIEVGDFSIYGIIVGVCIYEGTIDEDLIMY